MGDEITDRLSQLMSHLEEGGEGGEGEAGEEGLVKMMEGMMGTLLSREVLYPSLSEICKQVSYYTHPTITNVPCRDPVIQWNLR